MHNTEHRAKRTEHTLTGNAQNQQQSSLRAWGGWGQPSLRSSSSWAFVDKKRGPGQSHCQSQKLPATKVNCPSAAAAAWPDALGLREQSATVAVAVAVAAGMWEEEIGGGGEGGGGGTVASAMAPLASTREEGVTVSSAGWEGHTERAAAVAAGAFNTKEAVEAAPTTA